MSTLADNIAKQSSTAIETRLCMACGEVAHPAGIASCPQVQEVEFDTYGQVVKVVKR